MDDLVTFIRARWQEDEEAARAATPGPWEYADLGRFKPSPGNPPLETPSINLGDGRVFADDGEQLTVEDMKHIARHDPARVLAEVQAKRAMCKFYEDYREAGQGNPGLGGMLDGLVFAMRRFVIAYRDHPDYRPEWAPGSMR